MLKIILCEKYLREFTGSVHYLMVFYVKKYFELPTTKFDKREKNNKCTNIKK